MLREVIAVNLLKSTFDFISFHPLFLEIHILFYLPSSTQFGLNILSPLTERSVGDGALSKRCIMQHLL